MGKYGQLFVSSFTDYGNYLLQEVLQPSWGNYFYWLLGLSVFFWLLEIVQPWRKQQALVRIVSAPAATPFPGKLPRKAAARSC